MKYEYQTIGNYYMTDMLKHGWELVSRGFLSSTYRKQVEEREPAITLIGTPAVKPEQPLHTMVPSTYDEPDAKYLRCSKCGQELWVKLSHGQDELLEVADKILQKDKAIFEKLA